MSNKVEHNQGKSKNYENEVPEDDYDYDTDYDSGEVDEGGPVEPGQHSQGTGATKNYGGPQGPGGYGQGYGSPGGPAGGGSFPESFGNENSQLIKDLVQQGYTYEQAAQVYQAQTGEPLPYEEWAYMKQGMQSFDGPYPSKYKGYGQSTNQVYKGYGSPQWNAWEQNQKMMMDAKDMAREGKKKAHEEKIKINLILMKILMGDIVGALQSWVHLKEKTTQSFARKVVEKLYAIGKARTGVIRKFAMDKPPRSYGGKDTGQAARAQDKAQDYSKRVQFYTQLMNEYQNTDRELSDLLQTVFRDKENDWQSYSSFRDEAFKTSDKVLTWR